MPGLTTARTGGVGSQGSLFVRGGESRFARVFVDGVPVNQPGGTYDFGSAVPLEYERVEVVRGAASSLYGTDALAGVVHFVSRRGQGDPSATLEAEGGDTDWRRGLGSTAGRAGVFDWNVGLQRLTTDNEVPNNRFEQTAGAASLGTRVGSQGSLRLVVRVDSSETGTPGQVLFGRPDLDASFERDDRVLGASFRWAGTALSHELHAGLAQTRQLTLNPLDSGSYTPSFGDITAAFPFSDFPNPLGFQNDTDRLSVGYQAERQLGGRHLLTAGVDLEHESGEIGSRADDELLSPHAHQRGRVPAGPRGAGRARVRNARRPHRAQRQLRHQGRAAGGRGLAGARRHGRDHRPRQRWRGHQGARLQPVVRPVLLRPGEPGLEGRTQPHVRPRGRAAAVRTAACSVAATAFHHEYLDQIAYVLADPDPFRGTYANLGKTRARGLELEVSAAPTPSLLLSAHYTHLDGEMLREHERLRPGVRGGRGAAAPAGGPGRRSPPAGPAGG